MTSTGISHFFIFRKITKSTPTCHELAKQLPKNRLLNETEWRGIGVQQSRGWVHYAIHKPEPHILLFRRALGTDPTTGKVDPALKKQAVEKYQREYGN